MTFEIFGYLVIGFLLGRISKCKFYYGYDEKKYYQADYGVLKRRE